MEILFYSGFVGCSPATLEKRIPINPQIGGRRGRHIRRDAGGRDGPPGRPLRLNDAACPAVKPYRLLLAFDEKPPERRLPLRQQGLAQQAFLLHRRDKGAGGVHRRTLPGLLAEPEIPDDREPLLLALDGTKGEALESRRPIGKPDG